MSEVSGAIPRPDGEQPADGDTRPPVENRGGASLSGVRDAYPVDNLPTDQTGTAEPYEPLAGLDAATHVDAAAQYTVDDLPAGPEPGRPNSEAAALAERIGADPDIVGEAAARGPVSLADSIAVGEVAPEGRLAGVLGAIETGFETAQPRGGADGLDVVSNAAESVGLEPGVLAGMTPEGGFALRNVGNVTTYSLPDGQVLVMRGDTVLLNLIPERNR